MDMTGERRIPAAREKVFAALNDPAVLKACIPGCDTLEKTSDQDLAATASVKIGPISAKFAGKVHLSDIVPPEGYRISGEGQGGVAGFAKGGADVRLAEDNGGTLMTYTVQAQVGGKLAQLGARLIDATAKSMADQFFDRFVAVLTTPEPVVAEGPAAEDATHRIVAPPPPPPARISMLSMIPSEFFGLPIIAWVGIGIFFLIFVLVFSAYL
jgi:carbon monoxide dehydrogenase subunit G